MLRRTTYARTHTVSDYATPYDGRAREDYLGEVSVDRRTHEQHAHAVTTFDLTWPEADVQVRSTMDVTITGAGIDVGSRPSRPATATWSRLAPGRDRLPGRG